MQQDLIGFSAGESDCKWIFKISSIKLMVVAILSEQLLFNLISLLLFFVCFLIWFALMNQLGLS